MKNQYFGDKNDYRKYGLLRGLSDRGNLSSFVCWMLTKDDGSSDGRFTEYLRNASKWRGYDPELFDALHSIVVSSATRHVDACGPAGFLSRALFHTTELTDKAAERDRYFGKLASMSEGVDLVFFDPDNGLEVASCPRGAKGSAKFLYWRELAETYERGHSVLVYQHYPREERDAFTRRVAERMATELGAPSIHSFATARVLFLLAPKPRHADALRERAHAVARQWRGQISHTEHNAANNGGGMPDESATQPGDPSTAELGRALVRAELLARGAQKVEEEQHGRSIRLRVSTDGGRHQVRVRVKARGRRSRDWQARLADRDPPRTVDALETFWVFVDLATADSPTFFVVPDWWMRRDIQHHHEGYLIRHGGIRPETPESDHHKIEPYRVEKWEGQWELLGLRAD